MARVSIDDLWLKDDADGNPPTATVKRSLANARDPMKAKVPEKWRTPRYGIGKRWRCRLVRHQTRRQQTGQDQGVRQAL